jgi:hypothetical protein
MLSVIMLSVNMLSVIMLSVITLSVIMLSVNMLSVNMMRVIMMSVIMLGVVEPFIHILIRPRTYYQVSFTLAKFDANSRIRLSVTIMVPVLTLGDATLSIMTSSIRGLFATVSINDI